METLEDGTTIKNFTATHTIKTNSLGKVTDWFRGGKEGWIDSKNRQHFMINSSGSSLKGLYNHLPKKING